LKIGLLPQHLLPLLIGAEKKALQPTLAVSSIWVLG
jgi:hypothetical protein